jgi:sugar phosphate permease
MVTQSLPAPRLFYGWIVMVACLLITMVSSGTMMAFGVFINPMSVDLGWSHSVLSFSYAVSAIVSGLGILAVGSVLHVYSIRVLLFWGCVIHGLGLYMTSTVTTVAMFYFWYGFVSSIGRSVFILVSTTLITRWFVKRRGIAMGITMSGSGLGPFILSPVVTWMILRWDCQTAFVMQATVMTTVVALMCLVLRNYPHDMGLKPYGAAPDAPEAPTPKVTPNRTPPKSAESIGQLWRRVLRMEGFWTLSTINFFCCMCHSIPLVHVVGFAETSGLSAFAAAWVLSLMSLSSIAGRIVWGLFADRHGVRLTLFFTLFIQGTLVLWLVNTQDPVIFFLYAVVWGFGFGGVNTQYGVVARELYGSRYFGPGFSGQMCFAMVGMAAGGFFGGYLYDLSNSYIASWLVSFGSGLISSLLAMDLLVQSERTKAAQAMPVAEEARPAHAAGD